MVEAEEALEALGVLLVALQRLDQVQLLVDQGGVAARERHEHLADLRTKGGFTGGQGHGLLVQVIDRSGELTDLLVRGDVDPPERGRLVTGTNPVDRVRQVLVGDLQGAFTDPTDRVDQAAGDEECERDGRGQGEQRQEGVEESAALGSVRGLGKVVVDRGEERGLQVVILVVGAGATKAAAAARTLGTLAIVRTQGLDGGVGHAVLAGQTVEGDSLCSELSEEVDAATLAITSGQNLLLRQGESSAERLGHELKTRLGGELGVDDRGDKRGDTGLHLAHLGDPGAGADGVDVLGAEDLAEVEDDIDLPALLEGQVGCVARLLEPCGCSLQLDERVVELGLAGADRRLRRDHALLGRGEVADGRTDDRDLLGTGRGVGRLLEVVGHSQDTEDSCKEQRDRQRERNLAPQRPPGDGKAGETSLFGRALIAHVNPMTFIRRAARRGDLPASGNR